MVAISWRTVIDAIGNILLWHLVRGIGAKYGVLAFAMLIRVSRPPADATWLQVASFVNDI
jgi:hypothetical protein